MKYFYAPILPAIFCLVLSSCGGSESDPQSSKANPVESQASRFTKDIGKGCDLLTTELVASTFDVPAESLNQTKMMGCIYTWGDDTQELKVVLLMVRVHKDTAAAASWFARSTKSLSAEESQAEMDKVTKRLEDREELDTTAGKSLVKMILNSAGSKAVVFKDVANLGDEARSSADGGVSVRVSNLTFNLSAYHGPTQPEAKLAGLNVNEMIEVAKKQAQEWETKTAPQRTQDSAKLAKAMIAEL